MSGSKLSLKFEVEPDAAVKPAKSKYNSMRPLCPDDVSEQIDQFEAANGENFEHNFDTLFSDNNNPSDSYHPDNNPNVSEMDMHFATSRNMNSRKRPLSSSEPQDRIPLGVATRLQSGLVSMSEGNRTRFVWAEQLHKRFLLAIFQIGLDKAKPRSVFEQMSGQQPEIEDNEEEELTLTSNQVKRNLAKYRGNMDRTSLLFVANADAAMREARDELLNEPPSIAKTGRRTKSKSGHSSSSSILDCNDKSIPDAVAVKSLNSGFHAYPFPRDERYHVPMFEPIPQSLMHYQGFQNSYMHPFSSQIHSQQNSFDHEQEQTDDNIDLNFK